MTTHEQARLVCAFAELALKHMPDAIKTTLDQCSWWAGGEDTPTLDDLEDAISAMESSPAPAFCVIETGTVVMRVDGELASVEVRHGELVRVGPPLPADPTRQVVQAIPSPALDPVSNDQLAALLHLVPEEMTPSAVIDAISTMRTDLSRLARDVESSFLRLRVLVNEEHRNLASDIDRHF